MQEEGEEGAEGGEEGEEEGREILLSVLLRSIASSCTLTAVGVAGAEQVEVGGKVKALLTSLDSTFDSTSKEEADKRCLFC